MSLPEFCKGYEISISGHNENNTITRYLEKLNFFFKWLKQSNPFFSNKPISEITIDDMKYLKKADFEEFLHYIELNGARLENEIKELKTVGKYIKPLSPSTRNNYLCALNSLFNYFVDEEYLDVNYVARIRQKRVPNKTKIILDDEQKEKLLDAVDYGTINNSAQQEASRKKNQIRDHAILLILYRTGIRVSELVGLDDTDIDFKKHGFKVIRKRGAEEFVYFDDEVEQVLKDLLEDRKHYHPVDNERALFLTSKGSKRGSRISVRSVQILVKKYSELSTPEIGNALHPHSFRATCTTDILNKTNGDIRLAKAVMGHMSIETTTHYYNEDESLRESNRNLLL